MGVAATPIGVIKFGGSAGDAGRRKIFLTYGKWTPKGLLFHAQLFQLSRTSLHSGFRHMPLTPPMVSALSALGGSMIGALAPITSSFLAQRGQLQRDVILRDLEQRQALYTEFINEASRLYARSLTMHLDQTEELVALFALASRLRLMASIQVIEQAQKIIYEIVANYGEPDHSVEELRTRVLEKTIDPFGPFSGACRQELEAIRKRY